MILLATSLAFAAPCTTLVNDDLRDGVADGNRWGGYFTGDGWVADGGSIVYDLAAVAASGRFEIVLRGLEEAGVSQSDLAEMFSSFDGSFTDGRTDQFLQVKFAGDIYDGYDGRIKLQIGMEYGVSGTGELAMWSGENDWSAGDWHTLAVEWGDGWGQMWMDGNLFASVDYSPENGGYIPFVSLRIPNNGSYTYDPLLAGLTFGSAWLCGEIATPPSVSSWDLSPREIAAGDAVNVQWAVDGTVTSVLACGRPDAGGDTVCSANLGSASGSTTIPTDGMAVGSWTTWLDVNGGAATGASIPLVIHEAGWTPSSGGNGGDGGDSGTDNGGDNGTDSGGGGNGADTDPGGYGSQDPDNFLGATPSGGCGCGQIERGPRWGAVLGLLGLAGVGWARRRSPVR